MTDATDAADVADVTDVTASNRRTSSIEMFANWSTSARAAIIGARPAPPRYSTLHVRPPPPPRPPLARLAASTVRSSSAASAAATSDSALRAYASGDGGGSAHVTVAGELVAAAAVGEGSASAPSMRSRRPQLPPQPAVHDALLQVPWYHPSGSTSVSPGVEVTARNGQVTARNVGQHERGSPSADVTASNGMQPHERASPGRWTHAVTCGYICYIYYICCICYICRLAWPLDARRWRRARARIEGADVERVGAVACLHRALAV